MPKNAFEIPRKWKREPADLPVGLVLRADRFKKDDSATMLDVSLLGASVRTRLALATGDWVGVVIKDLFQGAIPSRVVWAREEGPNCWTLAGLEFLEALEILASVGAIERPTGQLDERQAA